MQYKSLRNYRSALSKTERAVKHLNASGVSVVLHLGDIVDGNISTGGNPMQDKTHEELDRVLTRLSFLKAPILHVLGNHCLFANRDHLFRKLKFEDKGYYFRELSSKWRLIVLDTVEVSILRGEDHPHQRQAWEYLESHKDEPNARTWNGGLGQEQLDWLEDVLLVTAGEGKLAIVCGHIPILAEAAESGGTVFNNAVVGGLLSAHSSVVKAYFCGHHHPGGYAYKNGIHHVTFEGILDADHEEGSCGVVELHDSRIVINGNGIMTSRILAL